MAIHYTDSGHSCLSRRSDHYGATNPCATGREVANSLHTLKGTITYSEVKKAVVKSITRGPSYSYRAVYLLGRIVARGRAEDIGVEWHVDGGAELAPVLACLAGLGARAHDAHKQQGKERDPGERRHGADLVHAVPPHSSPKRRRGDGSASCVPCSASRLGAAACWRLYWTGEREWDRVFDFVLGDGSTFWVKACGGTERGFGDGIC